MSAQIDLTPVFPEKNILQKKREAFVTPFSDYAAINAMQLSQQSVIALLRIMNELVTKSSGKTRDLQMWMGTYFEKRFFEGSYNARDHKIMGMKKSLDATQTINYWTMAAGGIAGILGVGAAITGYVGYMISRPLQEIANVVTSKKVIENVAEYTNRDGVVIGEQHSVLADYENTINNLNRETRDRLAELKNQMSTLIAKTCDAFDDALRSLSSVYKVPLAV